MVTGAAQNDGHYPDDSELWVRHSLPNDDQHDRDTWSWLTGWIISQCRPDGTRTAQRQAGRRTSVAPPAPRYHRRLNTGRILLIVAVD